MRDVDPRELAALSMRAPTIFDGPEFAALNAERAERVVHLVLGEPGTRLGLVAGIRDGRLRAPFSAPWSLPLLGKARPRIVDYERAAADLARAPSELGLEGVDLVLPAPLYAPDVVAKWSAALALAGFRPLLPDLTFHLDLRGDGGRLDPKARQKLTASGKHPARLVVASDDDGCARAYGVIAANRASHGHPLHMSLDELLAMRAHVPVDFAVLESDDGPAAAAVSYRLADDLVYVVSWGDDPATSLPHPMNVLAAQLGAHYLARGVACLDLGTASIEGRPQRGLADFKQSIGAVAGLRTRWATP